MTNACGHCVQRTIIHGGRFQALEALIGKVRPIVVLHISICTTQYTPVSLAQEGGHGWLGFERVGRVKMCSFPRLTLMEVFGRGISFLMRADCMSVIAEVDSQ